MVITVKTLNCNQADTAATVTGRQRSLPLNTLALLVLQGYPRCGWFTSILFTGASGVPPYSALAPSTYSASQFLKPIHIHDYN